MIEIAQFGAGRIGQIHAANIAAFQEVRLRYVVDVNAEAAQKLAARYGAKVVSEKEAFADRQVGAVLIASSTDTHARLAIAAAQAGKAIFCEKPIDLSLKKVDACWPKSRKPACRCSSASTGASIRASARSSGASTPARSARWSRW
jgi:myo-inositol 2-dehydrogenase/D-chiro-inositol 1-dehydrogenase